MSPKPKTSLTTDELLQVDADRADAALERAIASLGKARSAYRLAERTYAKAKELAEDAARRAGRTS